MSIGKREAFGSMAANAEGFFLIGQVVYLKSGSPAMTVNSMRGGSQVGRQFVSVEWFAGTELKRDMFDPECITTEKPAA